MRKFVFIRATTESLVLLVDSLSHIEYTSSNTFSIHCLGTEQGKRVTHTIVVTTDADRSNEAILQLSTEITSGKTDIHFTAIPLYNRDSVANLAIYTEPVFDIPYVIGITSISKVIEPTTVGPAGSDGADDAASVSLDNTNLITAPETNLQDFAEVVDHAILKDRGTGVATSYTATVSVGGTTFAVSAVHGEINSDEGFAHITYAGALGITVADLTAISTYVYVDKNSVLQQQTSIPTRQDWSRKMFLMRISMDIVTETIIAFAYLNNPSGHYTNSMRDIYSYLLAQGVPFKKDQVVTGRTDNLGFDVSAGSLMEFGGTGDINNANIKSFDAVSNASYQLLSSTDRIGTYTDLVKFWDNNGVITALGSTTLVGHRLYRFSSGNFAIQYGQGNYANMDLAKTGVLTEDYVLNNRVLNATFLGWWFIESIATNTGNTGSTITTAFAEYTLGVQGGISSALGGCLLKGNNLSDLLDTSAARTNIGLGNVPNTDFTSAVDLNTAKETNVVQTNITGNADTVTKTVSFINGSFYDDIATTKHYLPLGDPPNENPVVTSGYVASYSGVLMPCDTQVLSIELRLPSTLDSGTDITMEVRKISIGGAFNSDSLVESETLTVAGTDDANIAHFKYSSATLSVGEMLYVTIQSSVDSSTYQEWMVSVVVEYDWSTRFTSASTVIS
jgi:hypothetical protein